MADHLNNFCALPFAHTTITTNGNYAVCCQHNPPPASRVNINNADYSLWSNSQYLNDVKQSFIKNERHPGCHDCWKIEDAGQESLRLRTQQEYKILKLDQLAYIEIQLGNLCNLKCLMCNEHSSSAILAENIQLGINKYSQKDFQWNDVGFDNLEKIINLKPKVVSIRGGEPFYNKSLLDLIERLPNEICANMVLHITTNATMFNSQWLSAFDKFGLVRLMFSVDATGPLYEYMRFPADWKTTESNIDSVINKKNVKSLVSCVVQNLNIGSIHEIITWCKSRKIYLQLVQLEHPAYLSILNLPQHLKLSTVEYLHSILNDELEPHIFKFLTQVYQQINKSLNDNANDELWSIFQTQIAMRDSIRQNSHKQFLKY